MTTLGSTCGFPTRPDRGIGADNRLMLEARRGAWWDAKQNRAVAAADRNFKGWLVSITELRHPPSGCLVIGLGVALFRAGESGKMPDCAVTSWIFGGSRIRAHTAMSATLCSPADIRWMPSGDTLNILYGGLRLRDLPWLRPACALS